MNNNHHPFPFYDNAFWLDNSTLSAWKECSRKYEYDSLELRRATFTKAALNYGKGIHVALAGLALSCGNTYTNANLDQLNKLLATHFERFPQPPDDHRTLGLAQETLRRYISTYEIEPWTIKTANGFPMIERLLWFPGFSNYKGTPINLYGLLDLVVEKHDGIWIVDRKTTSMLGTMFDYEMAMTAQMKGYCWLFKKAFQIVPMGFIVDAIRSLAPSEKALANKTLLEKWWHEQFRRLPFFVNEDQLDEWEETTKQQIDEMCWQADRQIWPMNDNSCVSKYGRREVYDACSLPKEQRPVALASNFFEENDWVEQTLKGKL